MADEQDEWPSVKRPRFCSEATSDVEDESFAGRGEVEQIYDPNQLSHGDRKMNSAYTYQSREQDGRPNDLLGDEIAKSSDLSRPEHDESDEEDNKTDDSLPIAGPMGWVQRQMMMGVSARQVLSHMYPNAQLPPEMSEAHLWRIVIEILSEPTPRQKLSYVNTLDDVVGLLQTSKNVIVLTGAGVSVSCGIPDFRSRDGIYARLSEEYPDLPDPQSMFSIKYFFQNPKPFFKFAKEIYPGQFKPSLSHRFIKQLETNGQLLRNYSQNIDTLEQVAGISRVLQCHGSFSTASCTNCKHKVSADAIKADIFHQVIPSCPHCKQDGEELAIMKPDIVFFGESLPAEFYQRLEEDMEKADLIIVIGSSLKVRPVALIPNHVPSETPQILINREPLNHLTFDVELLGDCDAIVAELCERMGGNWMGILDGFKAPTVNRELLMQLDRQSASDNGSEEETECGPQETEDGTETHGIGSHHCSATDPVTSTSIESATETGSQSKTPDCCRGDQEEDLPVYIFQEPNRYIFHGAEVCRADSPLPSPASNESLSSDSDSNSEFSDSDRHDGSSKGEADLSGYGTGSPLSEAHVTSTDDKLAWITGGISSYTCTSQNNSRESFADSGESQTMVDFDSIQPVFDPLGDDAQFQPEHFADEHTVSEPTGPVPEGTTEDDLTDTNQKEIAEQTKELLNNPMDNSS